MSTPHTIDSQSKQGAAAAGLAASQARTSPIGAAVQMRGIRHRFAAVPVIEDVTLEIAPGELAGGAAAGLRTRRDG